VAARLPRLVSSLALLLFLVPVAAGLAGTLLPAFDWLPALGRTRPSAEPWRALLAAPGLASAVAATLTSGVLGTIAALLLAVLVLAACHDRPAMRLVRGLLAPLLAVPHLATAIGLAFLLAPSGWFARLLSPWLTGWQRPPDLLTVNDPWGLALALGLALRETPFLLFVLLAAETQVDVRHQLAAGRALGCGSAEAWLKLVLPQLYPQIRLPLWAVLAYGLSTVEMALVLGPTSPPTLAGLLLHWFNDPDLGLRFQAAAGALLLLALVLAVIALWRLAEAGVARLARPWVLAGPGRLADALARSLGAAGLALVYGLGATAILALALWSLADRWSFPAVLPESLSLTAWARQGVRLAEPLWTTLALGLASSLIALVLALWLLQSMAAGRVARSGPSLRLLYLPLIVPQISFVFGLQILLLTLDLDGTLTGVALAHLVFVLPYTILVLEGPWRRLYPAYAEAARSLGHSPGSVLFRIELPLLLRPILAALAIGFSVSVAQYLPTLFAGAGRIPTLTTEALALAVGADRRHAAVAGLWLAALPLAALALALVAPAWRREGENQPAAARR
jgi:putative thiamine transport system permease protein